MENDPSSKNEVMERIWEKMKKSTDLPPGFSGEYIQYIATDPQYLYEVGFVDTKNFSFEEWEKALEPYKQTDGTYLISKDQFIALGKYKFAGLVKKPLDAMQIKEGWYPLQEWHLFLVRSVIPSLSLPVENMLEAEKQLKDSGQIKKGKILVDKALKLRIKAMLDQFPSPMRQRELGVEKASQEIEENNTATV